MKEKNAFFRTTIHAVNGSLFQIPKYNKEPLAIYNRNFIVRITVDRFGKSLSISDENSGGAKYVIPIEPIEGRLRQILKE